MPVIYNNYNPFADIISTFQQEFEKAYSVSRGGPSNAPPAAEDAPGPDQPGPQPGPHPGPHHGPHGFHGRHHGGRHGRHHGPHGFPPGPPPPGARGFHGPCRGCPASQFFPGAFPAQADGGADSQPDATGAGPWGGYRSRRVEEDADAAFSPALDLFETEKDYQVVVSLPGASANSIDVDFDTQTSELTIAGETKRYGPFADAEVFANAVQLNERKVGKFERRIRLGEPGVPLAIVEDGITAKYANGVLEVVVPKSDVPRRRKVVVEADDWIDAGASDSASVRSATPPAVEDKPEADRLD
ncbi:HSP20-like chaperone [Dipodascopsis tothii]|uniref:HSP20-like chaperone n=1 Tax=Dipodascopsis tothii TaxID=44089 RepID=UPI0034CEA3F1